MEYPGAQQHAQTWQREDWTALYRADEPDLVRYYAYVDVVLEFCNTVLRAWRLSQIPDSAYEHRYGRLVRLALTENRPIISEMEAVSPYLSQDVRDEIARRRASGWYWDAHHAALAKE